MVRKIARAPMAATGGSSRNGRWKFKAIQALSRCEGLHCDTPPFPHRRVCVLRCSMSHAFVSSLPRRTCRKPTKWWCR